MIGASNALTVRDLNRLLVLERIRLGSPVSRAEIARDTGLTAASVTNIVAHLISEGLVVETGRRPRKRGQPPVELDLAAGAAFSVGLHLDRDLLSGALVDLKGAILAEVRHDLLPPAPDEALALLAASYDDLLGRASVPPEKILGVGIVTVGPLDLERGLVLDPPNFPGWKEVPLRERLAEAVGVSVVLENNATAAAIGEHWYGAGRNRADFLYVYIGLGVGGGLFFNNRVYRGRGLNAGEFGHLLACSGGRADTLESRTSVLALQRDLGAGFEDLAAIAERFAERDERLLAWLERATDSLARAVAGIDNLLDLDAVIFGGRHDPAVLEHIVRLVREKARAYRMPNRPSYAEVLMGRVGDDTAALGAAALPIYQAFAPALGGRERGLRGHAGSKPER